MSVNELKEKLADVTDKCFATKDLDEKIKLAQQIIDLENEINTKVARNNDS